MGADDHLLRIKPRVEAGKAPQVINCINAGVYALISAWKHRFKIIDKRRPEDPSMAFNQDVRLCTNCVRCTAETLIVLGPLLPQQR